jgi:hypothetical protein
MMSLDKPRGFSELVALNHTFIVFAAQYQSVFPVENFDNPAAVAAVDQNPADEGAQLLQKLAVHGKYSGPRVGNNQV